MNDSSVPFRSAIQLSQLLEQKKISAASFSTFISPASRGTTSGFEDEIRYLIRVLGL
jgi:hypothetical protein